MSKRGGARTALALAGLIAVGFFWAAIVLVASIALADKGQGAWWAVLIFGALPLLGLYRIRDRWVHRPTERPPEGNQTTTASGLPDSRQTVANLEKADHDAGAQRAEADRLVIIEDLTNREREILALLGRGRTNGQIAQELYISIGTVKSHVNSILRKLGASNRTEAVDRGRHASLI